MKFLGGLLDRLVLLVAVVAAGCVPSFIVQYRQRLGGRLDQVLADLAPFQAIADRNHGGSLDELIRYHLQSSDATFHQEGAALQAMVQAAARLRSMLAGARHRCAAPIGVSAAPPRHGTAARHLERLSAGIYAGPAERGICAGGRGRAVDAVSCALARRRAAGACGARSAVAPHRRAHRAARRRAAWNRGCAKMAAHGPAVARRRPAPVGVAPSLRIP